MIKNPHIQTIIGPLLKQGACSQHQRMRLELQDGDFIDYDYYRSHGKEDWAILLPGLGGTSDSHYIIALVKQLVAAGQSVVIVRYRGSSGITNRKEGGYHFGMLADIKDIIEHVRHTFCPKRLSFIGFSMGGNLLLRLIAGGFKEYHHAVCVSIPFCLETTSLALNQGFSRVYQHRMLSDLKKLIQLKYIGKTKPKAAIEALSSRSFRHFDQVYTAAINDFKDRNDYYQCADIGRILDQVSSKVHLIQALDDPIVPETSIPQILINDEHPWIKSVMHRYGGHVGFWQRQGLSIQSKLFDWIVSEINGVS